MKKIYGTNETPLVECFNPIKGIYKIRFCKREEKDGAVSFMEETFIGKPTDDEIRSVIMGYYNTLCDDEILNGFVYDGNIVWLTLENQLNYKIALDLASQENFKTVKFKIGTLEEPVYVTFESYEELNNFVKDIHTYISQTLQKYWQIKDAINWELYTII